MLQLGKKRLDEQVEENIVEENLSESECILALDKLFARGPDKKNYKIIRDEQTNQIKLFMGFTRLAIMDTSDAGLQPFEDFDENMVVCNGEIYNWKELATRHSIELKTVCDCEIILPLYRAEGFQNMIADELDAEFAMILFNKSLSKIFIARDRYGVRPLFFGYNQKRRLFGIASELKALHDLMEVIEPVKPNCITVLDTKNLSKNILDAIKTKNYFDYNNLGASLYLSDRSYIREMIRDNLTSSVKKRLISDRPVGFLLSGGLDSSLIVSIATKILGPDKIVCFSVGLPGSPDVEASKRVVNFLNIKQHHIIPFDVKIAFESLSEVIRITETYDVTTIRASTPQYLMAKYIREKTDVRVLLSGEGSDEIHGSYRYFRDAPNMVEFHVETIRLLSELYLFDNLRTDRTMAGSGLEVRVPFLDFAYVEFITRINPVFLMYTKKEIEKEIYAEMIKKKIIRRTAEEKSKKIDGGTKTDGSDGVVKHAKKILSNKRLK